MPAKESGIETADGAAFRVDEECYRQAPSSGRFLDTLERRRDQTKIVWWSVIRWRQPIHTRNQVHHLLSDIVREHPARHDCMEG